MNEQNKVLNGIDLKIAKEPFLIGTHNAVAVQQLHAFVEKENGGIFTVFSKGKETGKTHLSQMIGDELWDMNVPCYYSTMQTFVPLVLLSAIKDCEEEKPFEKIYCQKKLNYILDDIHFAFDKDIIMKWLIGWLKHCVEDCKGKKVILTFKGDLQEINRDLKELLESQSVVEIEEPDPNFKKEIIKIWASENDVKLTEEEVFELSQGSLGEIKCMIRLKARGK